jgi:hypothetical protein
MSFRSCKRHANTKVIHIEAIVISVASDDQRQSFRWKAAESLNQDSALRQEAIGTCSYFVDGFAKLASMYPGLLPRFDSTFSQPFSSSTTLSVVPLGTSATTG